jgi:hypothetical protein
MQQVCLLLRKKILVLVPAQVGHILRFVRKTGLTCFLLAHALWQPVCSTIMGEFVRPEKLSARLPEVAVLPKLLPPKDILEPAFILLN